MLDERGLTIQRLVVLNDLLRIDDRTVGTATNPQRRISKWVDTLIGSLVQDALSLPSRSLFHGDEGGFSSVRWQFYSRLGLPLHYQSWASVFDNEEIAETLAPLLSEHVADAVVLCFEASPSLIAALRILRVPFVDCSIHPVRFLPDYYLGFRTNVTQWHHRIREFAIPSERIKEFARISSARTAVTLPDRFNETIPEQSAIFFGQMNVDASLVVDGRMADHDDLEHALISLVSAYGSGRVFYKRHPHNSDTANLEKLVKGIKGCNWIDINAYDALAHPHVDLAAALSSGTTHEAFYFGKKFRRFLERPYPFSEADDPDSSYYTGVYESYLSGEFWRFVLSDQQRPQVRFPDPYAGGLKFSLNKKWGR